MKRLTWFLIGVSALLTGGISRLTAQDVPGPEAVKDLQSLVTANNEFSLALHRQLRTNSTTNLIVSPFSISTALAVVHAGARGETANEIASTLKLDIPGDRVAKSFEHFLSVIADDSKGSRPGELVVANGLWVHKKFVLQDNFLGIVRSRFRSDLRVLDFEAAPEEGRKEINRWVEAKTKGKIHELVQPNEVNKQTRLVVTNAIYMKKSWVFQFAKDKTKDEWFLFGDKKELVPMMRARTPQFFYQGENIKLLRLPYDDLGRLAMCIILPDDKLEMAKLEQQVDWPSLKRWTGEMKVHDVDIALPRLKMDSRIHLREILTAMGLKLPFTDQADFTGMTSNGGYQVKDVIHQAHLSLDEQGTEAAAATAIIDQQPISLPRPQAPLPKAIFCADRPFLLFVQDTRTGAILFTGRFAGPGQ